MLRRVTACVPRRAAAEPPRASGTKPPAPAVPANNELDLPDNNGLSRGQNFMKVEKWLREARKTDQKSIAPGEIANLEDHSPDSRDVHVPSEKDRLAHQAPTLQTSRR